MRVRGFVTLLQVNHVDLASAEYAEIIELQPSPPKSDLSWLDLNLPVPEEPLPRFHDLPLNWVFALNAQLWTSTVYDDAYFARSLARKNPEPFVM